MIRRSDAALAATAVAVVVALGSALYPSAAPAAGSGAPDRPAWHADTPASVLFIGDSYTAGDGPRELSPGCRAALDMGWLCDLSAVPGTGYISGGSANRFTVDEYIGPSTSFRERIPGLAAVYQPAVVVLDGGRNDEFAPRDDVFKAMAATIAEASRAWPTARVVFSRPRFLAAPADDLGYDDAFVAGLAAASGDPSLVVIDPIHWLTGTNTAGLVGDDGIHPNRRGQDALASAITRSLMVHGLPGST